MHLLYINYKYFALIGCLGLIWGLSCCFFQVSLAQSTFSFTKVGPSTDIFHSACEAENGDLLISGISRSFSPNGTQDFYVVRLNMEGEVIWEEFYGGNDDEFGARIVPRQEGGFLVAGSTFSYGQGIDDLYFVAIDDSGDVEWETTIGDSLNQQIQDIISLPDGGFAVTGRWLEKDSLLGQAFFLRIDAAGNPVGFHTYGGTFFDYGRAIIQMSGNRFLLAGMLSVYSDSLLSWEIRMYLLCLDDSGQVLWSDTLKHPTNNSPNAGQPNKIIQLSDSSYMVLGDMAVHLDPNGTILSINDSPVATAAVPASNTDFLTTINGNLRYYQGGNGLLWEEVYNITSQDMIQTPDGGYLVVGHSDFDMLALKVNCRGTMHSDTAICNTPTIPDEFAVQFWPNPTSDILTFSIEGLRSGHQLDLEIIDPTGRKIYEAKSLVDGSTISIHEFSEGLYILRFKSPGNTIRTERLVILH